MAEKELEVYICSNVGIDYFFFLGRTISESGYKVRSTFLVSEENYRKLAKTGGLLKVWLRIKMYILYPFLLIYKVLASKKASIFVVTSNNFFAPYLVYLFLKFKSGKVIHLLYDLYPDAIEIAGAIKPHSFISNLIGKVMKRNLAKCDATVYLGQLLKEHAESRWGRAPFSDIIDISTDLDLYSNEFNNEINSDKIILHYGGQLGHLHDANSLIKSIKFVCSSDIAQFVQFNFYVSGAQAQFLEESLYGLPVKVISAVPSAQWREDIKNFHIGMVSLSPGGATVCLPSKTYGMMAGGMAILAIAPEWSDLSTLIRTLDSGWIINNAEVLNAEDLAVGDYMENIQKNKDSDLVAECFYSQLKIIINDRNNLAEKRENAFRNVRRQHNLTLLAEKWDRIINHISLPNLLK
ncbi:hypothetical protein ACVWYN_000091 [Pedobacter sp. UYP24]